MVDDSYEAIEVVQLAEEQPVVEVVTNDHAQAVGLPTETSTPLATNSLETFLAELEPAATETSLPQSSRPVVTFRKLEALAPPAEVMAALMYGSGALESEEEGGGGLGGLLGRIGAALSGAGHCPTPGGPLILR